MVLPSDLDRSATLHQLSLPITDVDCEALVHDALLELSLAFRALCLLSDVLKHLEHVLVGRAKIFLEVVRHPDNALINGWVKRNVLGLTRTDSKSDYEAEVSDQL